MTTENDKRDAIKTVIEAISKILLESDITEADAIIFGVANVKKADMVSSYAGSQDVLLAMCNGFIANFKG